MTYNVLVLGTYAVDTPEGGGKYVLYHLFKRLPFQFNIKFLSLVESDKIRKELLISPNFENIQIPQDIEQAKIQWKEESKNKTGLFDVIQINYWKHNSAYIETVKKQLLNCNVIILEHPYLANLIKSLNPHVPIIYHAHNLEFFQKEPILDSELLKDVKNVEQLACDLSNQVWGSSEIECNAFSTIYRVSQDKLKLLPHGADLSTKLIERIIHEKTKSKIKELKDTTTFVFVGSWHPPNLEALEFIISDLAQINKNFLFFIIGSVKDFYLSKHPESDIPENVILLGSITNDEKYGIYELSDFAINPMFSGAGTNLKMIEYMAAGLPIISTEFGARGLKISNKTLICGNENFIDNIKNITSSNYYGSPSIKENYDIIRNEYDYDKIAGKCTNLILELFNHEISILNNIFYDVVEEMNKMTILQHDNLVDEISKEIESIVKPLDA
ncbi:MAG TPA: glycosyltransferase [Nitrosopumilaceae archaeon]|nr:glycosyltransferase [Nitrosopumilaceae archaeon]